jgi:hypothetical protein
MMSQHSRPDWSTAAQPSTSRGLVVVHEPDERRFGHAHERVTRAEVAKRLAGLKGFDFGGEYEPSRRYSGPVYFVPSETIIGLNAARELDISDEHDLFGGVVPHPFVATKAITHPLVEPDAEAPAGWSHAFGEWVRDAVHQGFSAFTISDAICAGARLLEHGPARIKPVRATGGRGQVVVRGAAELRAALDEVDAEELALYGLVLEENLSEVTTYSVGQVRVADLVATYYGTQRLTSDNSGAAVYGGSDLFVVRGDFDTLLGLGMPEEARIAVAQARLYDRAALELFPGLFASRRNYDIAQGLNAAESRRSGVLEQSWRMGGASSAEIAALEAFRAEPTLNAVRASSVEIYGESEAPPHAIIFFRGVDEQDGPLMKYALLKGYRDAG